jgi:calcineurin-like phosphoesterase family protein
MVNTWFISDTHFGHKKILEYEKESRPFNSVEEMNETIIDRWNNTVRYHDIVYHLGDFCFGRKHMEIAARLKGNKKLVLGNHDIYPSSDYLRYFDKLYGCLFWKRCVLTHMPVHTNGLGSRWLLNVHGHLHSKRVQQLNPDNFQLSYLRDDYVEDINYFNVSCEQNNLTPIHADVIMERLKEIE